jgi:hypothetical protein
MSSPMFLLCLCTVSHCSRAASCASLDPAFSAGMCVAVCGCMCARFVFLVPCWMNTVSIVSIADSRVVSLVVIHGNSQPVSAAVALRTAVVHRGIWAHGQVLDALWGCSSRCYLHGPVTASPANGELWGGVRTGCSILPLDVFMV